ncbi:hypothetical protein BDE36_1099 [Arcticibacter tournemirensis]|uniref:hypothetical protein n=3 Tax=Arcticibacter tournemirensis TaxID=699437 RepID=UPI001151147B|nr:hypothetical protein [Arcticibacter tournemirensis]TQM49396.1 hypothetical protein BDE36_1099 [Arcticibacter tournemirensis]
MATVVRVFYSTYAILLEIAYRVWKVRHKCGFSIGDMAFLMNTPLSFLKKIENPTLNVPPSSLKTNAGEYQLPPKQKIAYYNLDQIDFIRGIFTDEPLEVLVPSAPLPNDRIDVEVVCQKSTGTRKITINLKDEQGKPELLYDFDKSTITKTGPRLLSDQDKLRELISARLSGSFFSKPQMAVEIFRDIYFKDKILCKPVALEKALGFFTSKRKGIRLKKTKPKNGHTVFVREEVV